MNEKKWTDDERSEAFERGLKTMEGIALELYRRGREPLLAELEDCRARNADLRTMLEQVTRDRDHVEESLVRLEAQRDEARAEVDAAYLERNQLVALLSKVFPAGLKRTEIPGWSPEWHGCVFVDFPWGQASWHYHERDAALFAHLGPYTGKWDGHTTEEKYKAIAAAQVASYADLRAEVERLRAELIRAGSRECDIPACNCGTWHHQSPRGAYRRGAEAMREACARWMSEREGISQWVYDDALSALPIPEEK